MTEKRKAIRGRFYTSTAPAEVAAMDIGVQRKTHQSGFRLAHDAGFQRYIGSSYEHGDRDIRGGELPRGLSHILLGFRLVWGGA